MLMNVFGYFFMFIYRTTESKKCLIRVNDLLANYRISGFVLNSEFGCTHGKGQALAAASFCLASFSFSLAAFFAAAACTTSG